MYTSTDALYEKFVGCNQQISTDSRKISQGCLYLALKGDNFDGNQFAHQALAQGAAFAVVDDASLVTNEQILLVENGLTALQALARHHRLKSSAVVIGITGSNGKTTTKELIAQVLSSHFNTHATPGNLNNHIGVPLTLLGIRQEHEMAVVEMGANHPGEVELLCDLVLPDCGVVTSIGKEHLEGFGSIEAIIQTECALYDQLILNEGVVFVNHDDEILFPRTSHYRNRFSYGKNKEADVVGAMSPGELQLKMRWETAYSALPGAPVLQTQLSGDYNFYNVMAAVTIGKYYGVPYRKINEAIHAYQPKNNRSQLIEVGSNVFLVDCYNANPSSMEKALEYLERVKTDKTKVIVLGDMFELGDFEEEEHRAILRKALHTNAKQILLAGKAFAKVASEVKDARVYSFPDTTTLKNEIPSTRLENCMVLLKGSRSMKLELYLQD